MVIIVQRIVGKIQMEDESVECPACKSKSWAIYPVGEKIQCCRCGLSYTVKVLNNAKVELIKNTIPSNEIVETLKIFDGQD